MSATCLLATASARAVNVLVLSCGYAPVDNAVVARLQGFGHTVQLGPAFTGFDGTQSLSGVQVVYFQASANWSTGDMPVAGQAALVNFITSGGGLVTSEWVVWKWASTQYFQTVGTTFGAALTSYNYTGQATTTYTAAAADAILDSGLPQSFTFPLESYAGTETFLVAAPVATTYFNSVNGTTTYAGVIGRSAGAGRVLHISNTMGTSTLADANGGRLLSNAVNWAASGAGYAADYDGNGQVQPADVAAFVNAWFAALTNGC